MKKISLLSLAIAAATLAACGGDNTPDKPNLCEDLSVERCDQVIAPDSSSGSSSSDGPSEPPANAHLPFTETFAGADAGSVFNVAYKALLNLAPADTNAAFLYPASGLAEGRLAVKDNRFSMGNARFTIGQGYDVVGKHIDPLTIPADPKVNTSRALTDAQFPMTDSWGELDLRQQWKMSFCVENWEHTGSTANNQLFQVFVDNNSSGKGNSIHGNNSLLVESNVDKFTRGKRVEIYVPGQILSGGVMVDEIFTNPGRKNSFLQVRVPSAASLTMSNFWMGYQSDTSSEPSADTCVVGANVDTFNKPLPPVAPLTAEILSASNTLRVTWPAAPRATTYSVRVNTVDDLATATEVATAITTPTFNVGDLINGTTYYVWISAANDQGASEWSVAFNGVPDIPATAPEAVVGVKRFANDGRATLYWDANAAATGYKVLKNTANDLAGATLVANITEPQLIIKDLINATPYYIFVVAYNAVGDAPAAVIDVTANVSNVLYQSDFSVTKDQFFGLGGVLPATTISAAVDKSIHYITGGGSNLLIADNKLTLNNGRFTIGQEYQETDGVRSLPATVATKNPIGGYLNLANNYEIHFTLSSRTGGATSGNFQIYVDNNTSGSGNSLHGSKSRVYHTLASTIELNTPQVVQVVDDNHVGTANSFLQLRTEGSSIVEIVDFKIVDLGTAPVKTPPPASSSASDSSSTSSSPTSSSAPTSSDPSSSASSSSVSSSVSSDNTSVSSSSSSSAPAIAADVTRSWEGFDSQDYASILSAAPGTSNNAITKSTTEYSLNGLSFFHDATGTLRHRGGANLEWNFNGTGWASGNPVVVVGDAAPEMRAYIGVPVKAGDAVTITVNHRNSSSGNTLGSLIFMGSDNTVLAKFDSTSSTATPTSYSLPAGHTYSHVKITFSREGAGTGGMHLSEIKRIYPAN